MFVSCLANCLDSLMCWFFQIWWIIVWYWFSPQILSVSLSLPSDILLFCFFFHSLYSLFFSLYSPFLPLSFSTSVVLRFQPISSKVGYWRTTAPYFFLFPSLQCLRDILVDNYVSLHLKNVMLSSNLDNKVKGW